MKIKRQSPHCLRSSLCQGPAASLDSRVRILSGQPRSPVSGLIFPGWREPPISPRVRPMRLSLWPAISSISVLWGAGLGAGLCSLFSNFRFGIAETGLIFHGDWFSLCPWGIGRDLGIVSISPWIFACVIPYLRGRFGVKGIDRQVGSPASSASSLPRKMISSSFVWTVTRPERRAC
jgi:hypothetical protein